MTEDARAAMVSTYLKQLRLPAMARDASRLAGEAEQRGLGYLGYLQVLLEGEVAEREERQRRLRVMCEISIPGSTSHYAEAR